MSPLPLSFFRSRVRILQTEGERMDAVKEETRVQVVENVLLLFLCKSFKAGRFFVDSLNETCAK